MKLTPEQLCVYCGEKKKQVPFLFTFLKIIFISFITLTSLIGTASIYNITSSKVYDENVLFSIGGLFSVGFNFFANYETLLNPELKGVAINLTKECADDYCKTKIIYYYISKEFTYETGSNWNTKELWDEKEGDCDELSYLYVSMLKSIGINAVMQCYLGSISGHCYSVINLEDKIILVDITKYRWIEWEA